MCVCILLTQLLTGSLAYLPRKRAARHRGKVKRLVQDQKFPCSIGYSKAVY
jgi:hypothetical protein